MSRIELFHQLFGQLIGRSAWQLLIRVHDFSEDPPPFVHLLQGCSVSEPENIVTTPEVQLLHWSAPSIASERFSIRGTYNCEPACGAYRTITLLIEPCSISKWPRSG